MNLLVMPYTKGALRLKNHVVIAPMMRSRALNNIPNELMVTYYKQRSAAGLIVTEGSSPSPDIRRSAAPFPIPLFTVTG